MLARPLRHNFHAGQNVHVKTQPVLALRSSEEEPLQGLIRCYEQLGLPAQARSYAEELKHRQNEQTDN